MWHILALLFTFCANILVRFILEIAKKLRFNSIYCEQCCYCQLNIIVLVVYAFPWILISIAQFWTLLCLGNKVFVLLIVLKYVFVLSCSFLLGNIGFRSLVHSSVLFVSLWAVIVCDWKCCSLSLLLITGFCRSISVKLISIRTLSAYYRWLLWYKITNSFILKCAFNFNYCCID